MPTVFDESVAGNALGAALDIAEAGQPADATSLLNALVSSTEHSYSIGAAALSGLSLESQLALVQLIEIVSDLPLDATERSTQTIQDLIEATAGLLDSLAVFDQISVDSGFSLGDVAALLISLRIIETLNLQDAIFGPTFAAASVESRLRLLDALANFFAEDMAATVAMNDVVQSIYRVIGSETSMLPLQSAAGEAMILRVMAAGQLELTGQTLLQMIWSGNAESLMSLEALFATRAGITTWAINTKIGAVTEYRNYEFNSFAQLGRMYLGAAESGLYRLAGDDDGGDPIIAQIKSGLMQMSATRVYGLRAVYLGMRADGEFFMRLEAGPGVDYVYRVLVRDMENTKIFTGKGLRHRYLAFELVSTGQDFDLDSVEFVPMRPRRRV